MKNKIFAPIFSDNMVLCRNKPVRFYGKTIAGTEISIDFNCFCLNTKSDDNGDWELIFPPMEAACGLTLTARIPGECETFNNIAIGEVWLAGGQSNMEFELARCTGWARIQNDRNPNVRFFYTPKFPYENDAYREAWDNAGWELSTSEGFRNWSAVGYYFACELQRKLGCTVGIIGCNWGGTSASAWMSREAIYEDADTRIYMDEFDAGIAGLSFEEQRGAYDEYAVEVAEWNKKCEALYAENPAISWDKVNELLGPTKWPGPMNCCNEFRPTGQYHQMLKRISPYTLRGFIYYQGEQDELRSGMYAALLGNLIRLWRKDWHDDSLEFIITQLPMHRYIGSPDLLNWPKIREAQMDVFNTMPHTGITVIPDCGQYNDIHPMDKDVVGLRMAYQALCNVYGVMDETEAYGPMYDSKEIIEDKLILHFKHATLGMYLKNTPDNYELAGEDKIFHPAAVVVKGDTVTLTSPDVPKPIYARYCFHDYCTPSLFGMNSLPAAPFRTDTDDEA